VYAPSSTLLAFTSRAACALTLSPLPFFSHSYLARLGESSFPHTLPPLLQLLVSLLAPRSPALTAFPGAYLRAALVAIAAANIATTVAAGVRTVDRVGSTANTPNNSVPAASSPGVVAATAFAVALPRALQQSSARMFGQKPSGDALTTTLLALAVLHETIATVTAARANADADATEQAQLLAQAAQRLRRLAKVNDQWDFFGTRSLLISQCPHFYLVLMPAYSSFACVSFLGLATDPRALSALLGRRSLVHLARGRVTQLKALLPAAWRLASGPAGAVAPPSDSGSGTAEAVTPDRREPLSELLATWGHAAQTTIPPTTIASATVQQPAVSVLSHPDQRPPNTLMSRLSRFQSGSAAERSRQESNTMPTAPHAEKELTTDAEAPRGRSGETVIIGDAPRQASRTAGSPAFGRLRTRVHLWRTPVVSPSPTRGVLASAPPAEASGICAAVEYDVPVSAQL
jgi:hypothetical protein